MTKNILLGAITALVLAPTTVLAADLPMKAAPAVPPPYNWTGFYIGATAGLSLGTSDHLDPASGVSFAQGYDLKGGLAGGTIGYNWQMSQFVLGFEGDGSWVGEYGSSGAYGDQGPLGNTAFTSFTKETWLGTARLRFGYAANNLLYYGTGGYAVAGTQAGVRNLQTNTLLDSASSTRSGWTAGGGIEWGFAPNWSAKFELLYMSFNSVTFNTVQAEGPRTVPLTDTIARIGINYRFGGPVVANY